MSILENILLKTIVNDLKYKVAENKHITKSQIITIYKICSVWRVNKYINCLRTFPHEERGNLSAQRNVDAISLSRHAIVNGKQFCFWAQQIQKRKTFKEICMVRKYRNDELISSNNFFGIPTSLEKHMSILVLSCF